MQHPDFGMLVIMMALTIGTATLFVYCYFGKMASESYGEMSNCLYECNWVELSPKQQKRIIMIIENAQRPLYYHGFGMAVLHLESFTKVQNKNDRSVNFSNTLFISISFSQLIRLVFSFYMMFKTLTD